MRERSTIVKEITTISFITETLHETRGNSQYFIREEEQENLPKVGENSEENKRMQAQGQKLLEPSLLHFRG